MDANSTQFAAIVLDTGTTLPAQITTLSTDVSDIPTNAEFDARTIVSSAYATATKLATVDSNVDAIRVDTSTTIPGQISGLKDFDPANDTVATVTTVANMRGTDGANTVTPPTVIDILTTQMVESYSADGVAPTLAQSLFLTMQNLQDYTYVGTTQTVRRINGTTTAATYTLDNATNPTAKTRTS